jgi:hypothetical protein
MNRITDSMIQARIDRLNKLTGSPAEPYTDGKANIGNFHLSHAYGGVCLHRMHNDAGGVSAPLISGHVTKRDLFDALCAFLAGIDFTQRNFKD